MIIGADEVGYGSWAGPLVVCAVKAPVGWSLNGLNDSKQLSKKKREALSTILLKDSNIGYFIVEKSNELIDQKGLGVCLKEAFIEAINHFLTSEDEVIVDGVVKLPFGAQVKSLIKADCQIQAVMAASVIAKVYRDNLMQELDLKHPEYNWKKNVGYGSKQHKAAIIQYGKCDLHRHSYKIKL